ncbi:hypothetical protein AB5J72_41115 [Streptomyces sp. CG1]|uniref:hypothetical protein n=1 Tax=Streptomyces sp. CG1 TaxID=1287523 RepID=UPI0034E29780
MRRTPPRKLMVVDRPTPRPAVWMAGVGIALFALVGASAPNHNTLRAPITWLRLPAMSDTVSQTATITAIILSPVDSSDMASYAAYGRIAALGGDPYVTTPARLGSAYAHLVSEGGGTHRPCTGRWRRGGRALRHPSARSGRG